MTRNKIYYRITAAIIALFFLPMLFCGATGNKSPAEPLKKQSSTITLKDICCTPTAIYEEELTQTGAAKISGYRTLRRLVQPKSADYYITNVSFSPLTANIYYFRVNLSITALINCRKFIIRYIHHQDGYKI